MSTKGLFFVMSGPSGSGKNTLLSLLQKEFNHVVESISYTTRTPRKDEKEGVDYHFISQKAFLDKVQNGDFLEYAEVFGHYYGTDRHELMKQNELGNDVFLVIDTQGAMQIKGKFPAIFIFIKTPNKETLIYRLMERNTEDDEGIAKRISIAGKEMEACVHYDHIIVNDDLSVSYQKFRSIFLEEKQKCSTRENKK